MAPGTGNSFTRKYIARQASQKTVLAIGGGTVGPNLEAVILPSWLDEDTENSTNIVATLIPENLLPEPCSQPSICLVSLVLRTWLYRVAPTTDETYRVHMRSTP